METTQIVYQIPARLFFKFLTNLQSLHFFHQLEVHITSFLPLSRDSEKQVTLTALGGGNSEEQLVASSRYGALYHWWKDYEVLSDEVSLSEEKKLVITSF